MNENPEQILKSAAAREALELIRKIKATDESQTLGLWENLERVAKTIPKEEKAAYSLAARRIFKGGMTEPVSSLPIGTVNDDAPILELHESEIIPEQGSEASGVEKLKEEIDRLFKLGQEIEAERQSGNIVFDDPAEAKNFHDINREITTLHNISIARLETRYEVGNSVWLRGKIEQVAHVRNVLEKINETHHSAKENPPSKPESETEEEDQASKAEIQPPSFLLKRREERSTVGTEEADPETNLIEELQDARTAFARDAKGKEGTEEHTEYVAAYKNYRNFIFQTKGWQKAEEFRLKEEGLWGQWSGRLGLTKYRWTYIIGGGAAAAGVMAAMGPVRVLVGAGAGMATRFLLNKTHASDGIARLFEKQKSRDDIATAKVLEEKAKKDGITLEEFEKLHGEKLKAYSRRIRNERYGRLIASGLVGVGTYGALGNSLASEVMQDLGIRETVGSFLADGLLGKYFGFGFSRGVASSNGGVAERIEAYIQSQIERDRIEAQILADSKAGYVPPPDTSAPAETVSYDGDGDGGTDSFDYEEEDAQIREDAAEAVAAREAAEKALAAPATTPDTAGSPAPVAPTETPATPTPTETPAGTPAQPESAVVVTLPEGIEAGPGAKQDRCYGFIEMVASLKKQLLQLERSGSLSLSKDSLAYKIAYGNATEIAKELDGFRPQEDLAGGSLKESAIIGVKDRLYFDGNGNLHYSSTNPKFGDYQMADSNGTITAAEKFKGGWIDSKECPPENMAAVPGDTSPKTPTEVPPTEPTRVPEMPKIATPVEPATPETSSEMVPTETPAMEAVSTGVEWRELFGRQYSVHWPSVRGSFPRDFNAPVFLVKGATLEDAFRDVSTAKIPADYQAGINGQRVIVLEDANGDAQCAYVYSDGSVHWSRLPESSRVHKIFMDSAINRLAEEIGPKPSIQRQVLGGDLYNSLPKGKAELYFKHGYDSRGTQGVLRASEVNRQTNDLYLPPDDTPVNIKKLEDGTLIRVRPDGTPGLPTRAEYAEQGVRGALKHILQDPNASEETLAYMKENLLSKQIPKEFSNLEHFLILPARNYTNAGDVMFTSFRDVFLKLANGNEELARTMARRFSELSLEFSDTNESNRWSFDGDAGDGADSFVSKKSNLNNSYYTTNGSPKTFDQFIRDGVLNAAEHAAEKSHFTPIAPDMPSLNVDSSVAYEFDGGDSGVDTADAGGAENEATSAETDSDTDSTLHQETASAAEVYEVPQVVETEMSPAAHPVPETAANDNLNTNIDTEPVLENQNASLEAIHSDIDWLFGDGSMGSGARGIEAALAANDNPTIGEILYTDTETLPAEKRASLRSLQEFFLNNPTLLEGVKGTNVNVRTILSERGVLAA